jgi:hypothetical protein
LALPSDSGIDQALRSGIACEPHHSVGAYAFSNPPKQHKNDNDDQDDADDTDTAVSVTVTVATEAAAEAAKQENNENDNENESYRHNLISFRICGA